MIWTEAIDQSPHGDAFRVVADGIIAVVSGDGWVAQQKEKDSVCWETLRTHPSFWVDWLPVGTVVDIGTV